MNAEIVKVTRKAAAHYKNSDGYAQAAEIITMLCDELEKTQQPVSTPRTVASVLLERWAKDTREMAISRIQLDTLSGECTVDHDGRTVYYQNYEAALDGEIAYLNSPAK